MATSNISVVKVEETSNVEKLQQKLTNMKRSEMISFAKERLNIKNLYKLKKDVLINTMIKKYDNAWLLKQISSNVNKPKENKLPMIDIPKEKVGKIELAEFNEISRKDLLKKARYIRDRSI